MEFVPSNIIKTPDFGSMAQNAMNQKRQDIKEMNAWVDSNKKKEGAYLEGDKPAIQEAWNNYQQQLDMYVETDSQEAKRAADEAYGAYSQLAGTALANAEQYRSQVAAYKSDPSKFSISGQEFLSMTDQYRRTKRSADDIVSSAQNPFVIAQSMKYDLSDPLAQSQKLISMSAAKMKDFYDANGNLDTEAARAYAEQLALATINANESSVEKAMAWGGVRGGYAGGEDGMINSMEELEFLRNQPEEVRAGFVKNYQDELVNNFMNLLPNAKREDASGKKKLATDSISLQAAGGENVDFITLPGNVNGITQIGSAPDGEIFVTVEERVKTGEIDENGNEVYENKVEYRPATQTEVSKIMSKYGNTYDFSALKGGSKPAATATGEQKAQGEEPAVDQPVGDKPKDSLGLGLFDTAPTAEETQTPPAPEATAEEAPAEKAPYVPEGVEAQADATLDRISKGISAQELEDEKPYMLKEAQKIQSDIQQTRKEIAEAEKNGEDTAELNEKLDEQKRVLKKVNEVNRKISERRSRREFEQSLPELNVDGEQAPQAKAEEPAAKTKEPAGEGEEYVMINGKPYYKKDYEAVAGKKTGRGNYPDTFEEYAEQQNADILNTKDRPLTTMLDEATVTAKRTERSTAKQPVVPTQAGMSPTLRIKNESGKVEESTALNSNTYYDNVLKYEGGVSTDPDDLAAGLTENQDAPKTKVNGKQRLQHTNKGVTYSIFKNWAKEKGIKEKDYHDRFLKLSDDETKDIIDSYTRSVGADKLKSPALRAIFTQNAWGTGKVWAADFKSGRSPEYRAVLDWLQESTGMDFESTGKMSEEEAKAIEEFYNKDPKGFIETYTDKKIQHLKTLDTFDKHGRGWVRRANDLRDQLIADL